MKPINKGVVQQYVSENRDAFLKKGLECLGQIELARIMQPTNHYTLQAKNIHTFEGLIRALLDVHLFSQEEHILDEFLKSLAVAVCEEAFGGRKSAIDGFDLEFDRDGAHYVVSITSRPCGGKNSQIDWMTEDFQRLSRMLLANHPSANTIAVNGCCYGNNNVTDKGQNLQVCGQNFWELISGNTELYVWIIAPISDLAWRKNDAFDIAYARIINLFTQEFATLFGHGYAIDWEKLVRFNSAA